MEFVELPLASMSKEEIEDHMSEIFKTIYHMGMEDEPETDAGNAMEELAHAVDDNGGYHNDNWRYPLEAEEISDEDVQAIIRHQQTVKDVLSLEEAGKPTTNSNHSTERDKKTYDPTHGHTKPEGGNPDVCKECHGAGCTQCDDGQVITPKRHDKKVDEAENSPDGNVGADDDGDNDKYNQQQTVNDRKSIQEADELLDIIKNIRI